MAMTTSRARANRRVSVFSSDHAQRIAAKIRVFGVHEQSLRNVTPEGLADAQSQSRACFRA